MEACECEPLPSRQVLPTRREPKCRRAAGRGRCGAGAHYGHRRLRYRPRYRLRPLWLGAARSKPIGDRPRIAWRVREAPPACGVKVGDLVVGIVRRPDPVPCPSCAVGEWDMCRNGRYTERGIKERHGFGSEYFRIEPEFWSRSILRSARLAFCSNRPAWSRRRGTIPSGSVSAPAPGPQERCW